MIERSIKLLFPSFFFFLFPWKNPAKTITLTFSWHCCPISKSFQRLLTNSINFNVNTKSNRKTVSQFGASFTKIKLLFRLHNGIAARMNNILPFGEWILVHRYARRIGLDIKWEGGKEKKIHKRSDKNLSRFFFIPWFILEKNNFWSYLLLIN